MLATISGMPVHSRPECLNLNVRCSSTWRCMFMRAGAISCVLSCGGCTAWWGVARSGHDVAAAVWWSAIWWRAVWRSAA